MYREHAATPNSANTHDTNTRPLVEYRGVKLEDVDRVRVLI